MLNEQNQMVNAAGQALMSLPVDSTNKADFSEPLTAMSIPRSTVSEFAATTEVELGREQVRAGRARALVVNAGNSNAFTGHRGRAAVEQIMGQVAAHLGCDEREVFVSSTGVIGVPLPRDKARAGVAAAREASGYRPVRLRE